MNPHHQPLRATPSREHQRNLVRVAILALTALVLTTLASTSAADAAVVSPATVQLGTAGTYSVLGGTAVTNSSAGTWLGGDLGLAAAGSIVGFGPGDATVMGAWHDKDAAALTAEQDSRAAYDDAAARTGATGFAGDQIGRRFTPGLYRSTTAFSNTGTVTLDAEGDTSAVFIFQVNAAYSPAAGSSIVLAGGAQANNVFWQINGALSIGAGASYAGTFLVNGDITVGAGTSLAGRVLGNVAVTLSNNRFTTTTPVAPTPTPGTNNGNGSTGGGNGTGTGDTGTGTGAGAGLAYQPDAAIRRAHHGWVGAGVYSNSSAQQVRKHLLPRVRTTRFVVRLTNRGTLADSLKVRGSARNRAFTVTYLSAGANVTRAVRAGTFTTKQLAPGQFTRLVVKVTRTRAVTHWHRRAFKVRAISTHAAASRDEVRAVVRWGL